MDGRSESVWVELGSVVRKGSSLWWDVLEFAIGSLVSQMHCLAPRRFFSASPSLLSWWDMSWIGKSFCTLFLALLIFVRPWVRHSYLTSSSLKWKRHLPNEGESKTLLLLLLSFRKRHRGTISHQQKLQWNILKLLLTSLALFSSLLTRGRGNVNFIFSEQVIVFPVHFNLFLICNT